MVERSVRTVGRTPQEGGCQPSECFLAHDVHVAEAGGGHAAEVGARFEEQY
ncbi:hypothetical protein SDC9_208221 [bioreactor metagenome]|uniref:Uncharacterized protein n=1 Tax=bioreactor metagenome TaxID=1076179 RepID=A0A645JLI4_9ZZZZ